MDTSTFESLQQIRDRFGAGIFGKIAQKLLALAFCESGFTRVDEHGVQGTDIDVATDTVKYTLEVKTTEGQTVPISEENINALKVRAKDGYIPMVAVLRMQMFEDWVFAIVPFNRLQPGLIPISMLRPYRTKELEASIRPAFDQVVRQHFAGTLTKGEYYLKEILDEKRLRGTP